MSRLRFSPAALQAICLAYQRPLTEPAAQGVAQLQEMRRKHWERQRREEGRARGRRERERDAQRRARGAAVLVPLCHDAESGEAAVLFTERTMHVGSHKGEVSFPGGHVEKGECFVDAAVRETFEELGEVALRGRVHVLGAMDPIPAKNATPVFPVIAWLGEKALRIDELDLNTHEVESAFTVPVRTLVNGDQRGLQTIRGYRMPVFYGGPQRIWGFTAFVLDSVLKTAICPALEISQPLKYRKGNAT